MGSVTTPPVEQARSIFADLGYTITTQGSSTEFRAERDWKVVKVTPVSSPEEAPPGEPGEYRCFVTHQPEETRLRRYLQAVDPEYEWAIIAIGDESEYDVVRAPPTVV